MTDKNLETKILELKEYKALRDDLNREIEALEEQLKAEMKTRQTSDLSVGVHKLRYKEVISNRFDSKMFKVVHRDLYRAFTKQTHSMRFTVS